MYSNQHVGTVDPKYHIWGGVCLQFGNRQSIVLQTGDLNYFVTDRRKDSAWRHAWIGRVMWRRGIKPPLLRPNG